MGLKEQEHFQQIELVKRAKVLKSMIKHRTKSGNPNARVKGNWIA